jgi:hypothetical protein
MSGSHVTCFHRHLPRKERIMLQPVPAISNIIAASQKQAVTVGTGVTSPSAASTATATAALSHAASATVEGKLSIMLMAIRDSMVQSLLDIMNTVSESLGSPPEADESNVAHALRLADVIQGLTPKQLATVQQQLPAQGQTLPLQLVAQALKDPAGPEAAHIIAYLETARFKGRDLVAEAVIDSYGENEGLPIGEETAAAPEAHPNTSAAPQATSGEPRTEQTTTSDRTNYNPAAAPAEEKQVAEEIQASPQSAQVDVAEELVSDPLIATVISIEEEPAQASADASGEAAAFVAASVAEALEAVADNQPSDAATFDPQIMQNALPTELKEIAADVQEGLKVAIQFAMEAVGPEIDSIRAEGEQVANAVIANALIADVLDAAELHQQDVARSAGELPLPLANIPVQAWQEAADDAAAPFSSGYPPPPSDGTPLTPAQAAAAAVSTPPPAQLPLGVPFAIVQYPPAPDVVGKKDESGVDRVEAVSDEAEGKGRRRERAEEEEQPDDAEEQAQDTPKRAADASDELPVSADDVVAEDAAQEPLALPMPAPLTGLQQEAYDFYQRMAAE